MATRKAPQTQPTGDGVSALLHLYDAQCARHGNSRTGYYLPSRAPNTPSCCVGHTGAAIRGAERARMLRVVSRERGLGWHCVLTPAGMRFARAWRREYREWANKVGRPL